jgi:hypothetical protein
VWRTGQHLEHLLRDLQALDGVHDPHAIEAALERLALEQLHHQVDLAVLGDVVVEDRHRVAMADLVGRVTLGEEAPAGLFVAGVLRVQHLDRRASAVAVGPGVHRRHPADGDQRVEVPLAPQPPPDAQVRLGGEPCAAASDQIWPRITITGVVCQAQRAARPVAARPPAADFRPRSWPADRDPGGHEAIFAGFFVPGPLAGTFRPCTPRPSPSRSAFTALHPKGHGPAALSLGDPDPAPGSAVPDDLPSPRCGRYRIGRLVGSGGMGRVYEAFDDLLARPVALKVMRADVPGTERRRFRREALLGARLLHPGLVRVYDVGLDPAATPSGWPWSTCPAPTSCAC